MQQQFVRLSEAAAQLGVDVMTVRRWLEWHAAHLSASANPEAGTRRVLTNGDLETLHLIKQLQSQGGTTATVNEHLSSVNITPVERIESPTEEHDTPETALAASGGPGTQESALVVVRPCNAP
jgi:DNA-binding transcriptional MerR regulator